jgi:uncharacterized integral membrane protein
MLRFSPEKSSPATEIRARASHQQKSESVPENIPEINTTEEKPQTAKPKTSNKCRWVLFIVILILIIFAAAVVYNFEQLPLGKQGQSALPPAASNKSNNP